MKTQKNTTNLSFEFSHIVDTHERTSELVNTVRIEIGYIQEAAEQASMLSETEKINFVDSLASRVEVLEKLLDYVVNDMNKTSVENYEFAGLLGDDEIRGRENNEKDS